jgi:hypothetical protein
MISKNNKSLEAPATTWKELRQKIESQNKQISLLLQSMRQERERLLSAVLQMESRLKSQNKKTNQTMSQSPKTGTN